VALGYAVERSGDHLAAGAPDEAVLDLPARTGAILITSDKDYGELVYRRQRENTGVLLMRLAGLSPSEKAGLVSAMVEKHHEDLTGSFTVLSHTAVRIRRHV
jgi:predicted nuclease of predicted toxin-antitoxin system